MAEPPADLAGRLFVAVPLSDALRDQLRQALRDASAGRPLPGRIVRPENWHLTLRFLGDTEAAAAARLLGALATAPLGVPIAASFDSLGAFPRPDRARVLWLGVGQGATELTALADVVNAAVLEAGCPVDDKPFRAHLTLARLDPPGDVRSLLDTTPFSPTGTMFDEIRVLRSHLGRGPAQYETLRAFRLQ
jgi:2'-5' RNA ligase